jgi:uncharacterized RmlC-like cupin family protein
MRPVSVRNAIGRGLRSPLLATALIVVFAGTVLATASSNFGPPVTLSRATLSESVHFNAGAVKFQTKGSVDFVMQSITIGTPGSSGWHGHTGVVLVNVVSGTVTRYDADCVATVNAAGSAFVESGENVPALVRNESTTTPVVLNATWIVPAGTPATGLRIDLPNPGCPQN